MLGIDLTVLMFFALFLFYVFQFVFITYNLFKDSQYKKFSKKEVVNTYIINWLIPSMISFFLLILF